MELSDYEVRNIDAFEKSISEKKWSKEGLVSILKLLANDYLQLKSIKQYSDAKGKSTQYIRKGKDVIKIAGFQMVPDCD